jgi:hypothetical protein
LQSRWLVDVLQGKIKLPPPDERAADVAAQEAWLARFDGVSRNNNHVWAQVGEGQCARRQPCWPAAGSQAFELACWAAPHRPHPSHAPSLLPLPPFATPATQHGKYHDALARDIAGRTYVHNPLAYVKNQAFAPLFPGNASLLKAGGAKARAAAKPPSAGIPVSATQATAAATA